MELMSVRQSNREQGADEETLQIQLHERRSTNAHPCPPLIFWDRSNCVGQLHLDLTLNRSHVPPTAGADHASNRSPAVLRHSAIVRRSSITTSRYAGP